MKTEVKDKSLIHSFQAIYTAPFGPGHANHREYISLWLVKNIENLVFLGLL